MGRSILRDGDERGEKIVSEFLDKHFYIECEDFHRVVDKVQQIKGVDTTFVKNGFQYVCDEKAALKYVNKNLQTFSMELSFFNAADNISIGWLLDSNKINNSFLFCWIDSAINDVLSSSDDIVIMEAALVRKNKIIDYLSNIGWTLDKLFLKCKKIRENPYEECGNFYKNEVKFSKSFQLKEKPINLLIKRSKLLEISDFSKKNSNGK